MVWDGIRCHGVVSYGWYWLAWCGVGWYIMVVCYWIVQDGIVWSGMVWDAMGWYRMVWKVTFDKTSVSDGVSEKVTTREAIYHL